MRQKSSVIILTCTIALVLVILPFLHGSVEAYPVLLGETTFTIPGFGSTYIPPPTGFDFAWGPCIDLSQPCYPVNMALVFDTLGVISASLTPQSFIITSSDDPDFNSVAKAIANFTPQLFGCAISFNTDFPTIGGDPLMAGYRGVQSGLPLGISAPGSILEYLQVTIAPFEILEVPWGTDINGPVTVYLVHEIGSSRPYDTTITIDAFGTPVPEPSTMLLLGSGLLGLAGLWRKFKK
jgi:hypothetical protein